MAEEPTTDSNAEMGLATDAADGGKRADDKKANLKSDAENTTPATPGQQTELNGEVRDTPRPRGRPRKIRADENAEKISSPRARKRGFSESDDEAGFRGFDSNTIAYPGLEIINRLLADMKNVSPLSTKRIRRPTVKVLENADTEASENRSRHVAEPEHTNAHKQDTDHESDMEVGAATGSSDDFSIFETRAEESTPTMSTTNPTPGRRGRRPSSLIAASPKQSAKSDTYKKPIDLGWKREVVNRSTGENAQGKSLVDVYYLSPNHQKLCNMREINAYLKTEKITNLSSENFTFTKDQIGMKKPIENIRENKSQPENATTNKSSANLTKTKEETDTPVKNADTPVKNADTPVKNADTPVQKKVAAKRGRPRLNPKPEAGAPSIENDVTPTSPKLKPKEVQNDVQTPKKGLARKETVKGSPMTRRSQQNQQSTPQASDAEQMDSASASEDLQSPVSEKTVKTNKRINKRTSVQEPCSIRCSTSTGGIPSLQCTICLCLYHAECVGCLEEEVGDKYICKNCKDDDETHQPASSTLNPPPLIPISFLGTNSGPKYKSQGLIPLPKLQRISRDESLPKLPKPSANLPKFNSSLKSNEKKNDFYDTTNSLPAQNLAVMNGKKYIVIPKDNAMAVQPAITMKRDKIREQAVPPPAKPDFQQQNSLSQNSAEVGTSSVNQKKCDDENESNDNMEIDDNFEEKIDQPKNDDLETIGTDDNNDKITETNKEVTRANFVKDNSEIVDNHERKKAAPQVEIDFRRYNIANACAYYDAFPRVFQYLKVQELLRASRVCKMWRDLVAHPSLWRTVRMKNSQVTDWDGFAEALNRYQTQHLDLRKILMPEGENIWAKFIEVLPKIKSLKKLELCRCPGTVVEAVIENCPQLETLRAMSIKTETLDVGQIREFINCKELRLKAIAGAHSMTLSQSLKPLCELTQLIHLSLTSVKELGKKDVHLVKNLVNLEVLELGECSDLPTNFGTEVIVNLPKLERLRLEKGQGECDTFNILEGVARSSNLTQLELVNFDIKKGFDLYLAKCKNIKRLLIIPTYISQSATSNHMILGGVTQLKATLINFIWGVTLELLRVTDLFVDQCSELKKRIKGDAIPVLKPIPCAELIEDILKDAVKSAENEELAEMEKLKGDAQTNTENLPEVDILTLLQLQKLLIVALPDTRVKILKIPFHATWRQSLMDSAMQ